MKIQDSVVGSYKLLEIFTYVDVYNGHELKKVFDAVIDLRDENIAVVFHENYEHMDSSLIAILISTHKRLKAAGLKFAVIVENDEIVKLFDFAGLKDYFKIYRSIKELEDEETAPY